MAKRFIKAVKVSVGLVVMVSSLSVEDTLADYNAGVKCNIIASSDLVSFRRRMAPRETTGRIKTTGGRASIGAAS